MVTESNCTVNKKICVEIKWLNPQKKEFFRGLNSLDMFGIMIVGQYFRAVCGGRK